MRAATAVSVRNMAPSLGGAATLAGVSWEYLAVLGLCLGTAMPLEPTLRIGVLGQWRRLSFTLLAVAVPFGAWDAYGAAVGHWAYVGERLTGVQLLTLPLEEWLFFVVVPLCSIMGYEAVRTVLDARRPR